MKIFDMHNEAGQVVSFEIRNIGRSNVCRFVERKFAPTRVTRRDDDEFAEFEVAGRKFTLFEPYGDKSRFLIRQEVREPSPQLNALRTAFEDFQMSLRSLMFSEDRLLRGR